MDKKFIFIIGGTAGVILLIVLVLVFSSGSKKTTAGSFPTGPVTLTFWDPFNNSETLDPLFQDYQKLHPNVHIVFSKKDITTYQSDLLNALASNNGPDIFSINNSWLPQYLNKATSAPASIINFTDYKNTFVDAAVNDFTKNQKVYGIPLSVDSLALYYNKDLLGTAGIPTPPKTWNELATDVQRIKRQDSTGYFVRSGAALGTNKNINRAVDILYLMMLQQGTIPYSSDGGSPQFAQSVQQDGNYVNPGAMALSYYTSFADPSSLNYNWNARSDYSIDAFVNGRAAFLYSYSYTRATILQKSPNLNFDVAPIPQPNLDNPSVNFANYWGEVVSKQGKYPAVAWDFLKFLASKPELDKYYAANKVPSSRKDLIALQIPDPDIGVFASANLTAKSFYRPDQIKIDNIFGTMIDNVILNHMSVNDALQQAEQQAGTLGQN
jgi:ABC-type glycerol-3-phosphate transport system substrate-binding protein